MLSRVLAAVGLSISIATGALAAAIAPSQLSKANLATVLPDYKPVLTENFNTLKPGDPGSAFTLRRPGPRLGGTNQQEQISLATNLSGLAANDGALKLTTSPPPSGSTLYPTAMVSTFDHSLYTYGYFEVRVKFQTKPGHWSAFYLQSEENALGMTSNPADPTKLGAEIDVFEHAIAGSAQYPAHSTSHAVHWNGYGASEKQRLYENTPMLSTVDNDGWNTFGLLWTKDYYAFYINGKLSQQTSEGVSQRPEYLLLTLEVPDGSLTGWAGTPKVENFPDSYYIDYINVYQNNYNVTMRPGVPEPASLGLAASAVVLLGRRRRNAAL